METPRVLLVNDQENGLYLLERAVLREFPAAIVRTCCSGEEALDCWKAERFDAIFTDNRMPRMQGLDLVRAIRAEDQTTRVMMLTGCANVEADARAAGVSDFVCSGSWDVIRARIRNLLQAAAPSCSEEPRADADPRSDEI